MLGSALDSIVGRTTDGLPAALVSTTNYEDGRGAVWLIPGSQLPTVGEASAVDAVSTWKVTGEQAEDYLGSGVAAIGDVDGDGVDDIGIGASYADHGGYTEAGVAAVYTEAVGEVALADADIVFGGDFDGAHVGNRLQPAGDQDGDGYDDFMVAWGGGRLATVMPGGREALSPDDYISQVTQNGELGEFSPHMVGDINGDGEADLAIVLEHSDVAVFTLLSANPVSTQDNPTCKVVFDGHETWNYSVSGLGDIDGDGRGELLVHPQYAGNIDAEAASVVWGADLTLDAEITFGYSSLVALSSRDDAAYGYRADISDDVDGDGQRDIVLGGYRDDQGGVEAGGVTLLPVPR